MIWLSRIALLEETIIEADVGPDIEDDKAFNWAWEAEMLYIFVWKLNNLWAADEKLIKLL